MRNINSMLLSASLLVLLTAVFMTTSSVRGTRLLGDVDCSQYAEDADYHARCRSTTLDRCTVTNITHCTRRMQCDQDRDSLWTDSHACDVKCWVYVQPFLWFIQGTYEYPVITNTSTTNFDGQLLYLDMPYRQALHLFIMNIQRHMRRVDISQMGSIRIDITDDGWCQHRENHRGL